MSKPLICISALPSFVPGITMYGTKISYVEAVRAAGADAVLLPAGPDTSACGRMIRALDGLLVPGGQDVSPLVSGEEPIAQVTYSHAEDDRFEIALILAAIQQKKPIFGICRGMHIINVALGGNLYQDIYAQRVQTTVCHRQDMAIRDECTHSVHIEKDSLLATVLGKTETMVNSYHHQAVRDLGKGLRDVAESRDGIVEGMESADGMIQCVQWHPECLVTRHEDMRRLLCGFVERCRYSLAHP